MLKQLAYRKAKKYIKWVDGYSYNFAKNGEEWILKQTSDLGFKVIFDVGANIGSWTAHALKHYKNAEIHCFEISEQTYKSLQKNTTSKNCHLNNFGLSNENETIEYKDYGDNSGVNTILLDVDYHDKKIAPKLKKAQLQKGDDYCQTNKVNNIDFLKIDVEGAEHLVLTGFAKMLDEQRIRLIQFEYGYTNGDTKFLMRDFFKFFSEKGYKVGKLRRGKVEFTDWSYALNDFNSGPNFIAVRQSDTELIEKLKA